MTEEEYYAQIKSEYEASTDAKLVAWAQPYFDGTKKPNSRDKYIICPVSEHAANDIIQLTGSDVYGFNHVIRSDEVAHINKRHGKHGKADSTMKDIDDLGRMAYVLNNYDEIVVSDAKVKGFNNKNNSSASALLFVKRIDGHIYIAEALTDSLKQKELHIQTMYKARTSAYLAQKKEVAVDDEIPRPNVRNEATSTTSILPQPEKNVNSFEKNNSDVAEQPPSFAEIAEQNKTYRPPRKPRTSDNGNGKKPPNNGNSGR